MAPESRRREYLWLAVVAAVLVCALWLVRSHAESLKQFVEHHPIQGVIVYVILNILDAVIAPGMTLPLIPIAARAWGHVPAALVTTVGWTAGSLIAFYSARRWGSPIVKKLTSMERVKRLRPYIPKGAAFVSKHQSHRSRSHTARSPRPPKRTRRFTALFVCLAPIRVAAEHTLGKQAEFLGRLRHRSGRSQ